MTKGARLRILFPWVNFPSFKLLSRKIVGFVSQIVYRIIQPGASDKWCIASGTQGGGQNILSA